MGRFTGAAGRQIFFLSALSLSSQFFLIKCSLTSSFFYYLLFELCISLESVNQGEVDGVYNIMQ